MLCLSEATGPLVGLAARRLSLPEHPDYTTGLGHAQQRRAHKSAAPIGLRCVSTLDSSVWRSQTKARELHQSMHAPWQPHRLPHRVHACKRCPGNDKPCLRPTGQGWGLGHWGSAPARAEPSLPLQLTPRQHRQCRKAAPNEQDLQATVRKLFPLRRRIGGKRSDRRQPLTG